MKLVPETSTTLLRDIARDSQHARWGEFVARYRPMMDAYMRAKFPTLDADEAVQQTLIALIRTMPVYHYDPEEKGSFHAYLTGMLRHRAQGMIKEQGRERVRQEALVSHVAETKMLSGTSEDEEWRESLLKIALQQLLADESVSARTKEAFRRVAAAGESPAAVAESMGMSRNAVDQIKNRMVAKLRNLIVALEKADQTNA